MDSSARNFERYRPVALLSTVLQTVVLLLLLHAAVFFVFDLLPEATFSRLGTAAINPRTLEQTREHLGLSGSWWARYLRSLSNTAQGDFGKSIQSDYPVASLLAEGARTSLPVIVAVAAICVTVVIVSVRWYARPNLTFSQRALLAISPIALAPQFAVAAAFAVSASLGAASMNMGRSIPHFVNELLFVASIALMPASLLLLASAGSAQDIIRRKFVLTYRACGFSWAEIGRLIQPNVIRALLPLGTRIVLTITTGTVFAELSFNKPGIGAVLAEAVRSSDQPVAAGWMLTVATPLVLFSNVLAAINKRLPGT